MKIFLRSFALTFSLTVILFFGLFTMNAICAKTEQSGFSSGEFLLIESEGKSVSVEFLGKKADFDYSGISDLLVKAEPAALLLPPSSELLIRAINSIFYPKTAVL